MTAHDAFSSISHARVCGEIIRNTRHVPSCRSYSTLAILKTYPDLSKALRKDSSRFWAALTRLERASRVSRETYRNEYRKEKVRLIVRCASPPHPLATGAGAGRAAAPVNQADHRRGTGALAHWRTANVVMALAANGVNGGRMSESQFRVGRYICRVTLPDLRPGTVAHAVVEWDPRKPDRLSDAELKQYDAGLALALSGLTSNAVEGWQR